ncbi:hypothetical protein FAZ69_18810 [Trinickia terrae]|uniref:Uncharacterized protein n=1 Tax=Trinickia terrae TaxID=2571161 RepID=A0A4U1I0S2_9BURK|nr:hypothetical protein [Trinickia terrae]TKC86706.1 hypothetical protein FAZ69_18810 [Trinickia terrae]
MSAQNLYPLTMLGAALGAAAVLTMPATSAAGPMTGQGGIITFVGRIVGPSFEVSAAPIEPVTAAGGPSIAGTSRGLKVTFAAQAAGVPPAEVSFMANDAARSTIGPGAKDDVVTRFVDPKGRAFPWQPGGYYHLPPSGGVLSLTAPRADEKGEAKPITLIMSYE